MKSLVDLLALSFTVITEFIIYVYIQKHSRKDDQLIKAFSSMVICMILWCIGLVIQILIMNYFSESLAVYVDYLIYCPVVLLPVCMFFFAYIFSKKHISFKKWYLLLFVIPLLTVLVLWTNDLHHLFYESYSINTLTTVFGPYFYVHSFYTYGLIIVDLVILLKTSIRNTSLHSMQSLLIIAGAVVPLLINILGMTNLVPMSIYTTPISFCITVLLWGIAILKYNFLSVAPIALKRIVNQMSDLYIVLNKDYKISDCNEPFQNVFHMTRESVIGKYFDELNLNSKINIKNKSLSSCIEKAQVNNSIFKIDANLKDKSKFFNIEISGIFTDNQCVGILILFKDTTQHILDMETLKKNQNTLMERERLATLGQMVGGIAHNLKTPIMSIAGAMEGLQDLVTEYDKSIDDSEVTKEDHHAIAHDMSEWITKVNSYDSYMSDIITAVKGQTVNMNDTSSELFTIDELLKRVDILMRHELKNALITLNVNCIIDKNTLIAGNINSLVQVVNNLISNAIQSYNGEQDKNIDLTISKKDNNIAMSITDYGCGISEEVQKKLFKEMITTKGHNGTGLGLFMSYSTIKGHFKGDLTFSSKIDKGTTFNIILPVANVKSYFNK